VKTQSRTFSEVSKSDSHWLKRQRVSSLHPRQFVKQCAAGLLYPRRQSSWLETDEPVILYYHRVSDEDVDSAGVRSDITVSVRSFERQIECLLEHFEVVPLEDLAARIRSGQSTRGQIAVTFDDGYVDNYTYAYPILKKHQVPATIFIPTGHVGSRLRFWWDTMAALVTAMQQRPFNEADLPNDVFTPQLRTLLARVAARNAPLTALTNHLKGEGPERTRLVIDFLGRQVGSDMRLAPERLFLTWDEMREMSTNGVSFGSHTHTHPPLPGLTDSDLDHEIQESRAQLTANLGVPPAALSYPDGYFDERVVRAVRRAGYEYAVQTRRFLAERGMDIYSLPRRMVKESHSTGCFDQFSASIFMCEILGIFDQLAFRERRRKNPYKRPANLDASANVSGKDNAPEMVRPGQ
jgi:peptidoglycan/xylan/chitin deacetylase (PgdA/CDA1 family)